MRSKSKSSREIERKFVVRRLPSGLKSFVHHEIQQGYLAASPNGTQTRLRRSGRKYLLAIKRGSGINRREWEIELTAKQFEMLWPATKGHRLRKTRYDVPFGRLIIEVDIYNGRNKGLIVAEVEFDSAAQSRAFRPPDWLGRDVSDLSRYSNVKLARE